MEDCMEQNINQDLNNIGKINVYSEIGKLKTVLLHRPGEEIENLTPLYLKKMLFDDIPFLKIARNEHDMFADVLKKNRVKVLYLEDLASEAIKSSKLKSKFIEDTLFESNIKGKLIKDLLRKYLESLDEKMVVQKVMSGVRKRELGLKEDSDEFPFLLYPMPNLYFTRDPFASIGKGITINSMRTSIRRRESIFGRYILKYHPEFRNSDIPIWYNRHGRYCIEGGDELILSKDVLAIGEGERTDSEAIKQIAKNIFEEDETFKVILMVHIPKTRAFMHLDTIFTMVDFDKFTVHGCIESITKISSITYDKKKKELIINEEKDRLCNILSKYLKVDVKMICCGGGDKIVSAREQWNDGSNTLAIAPGKVVTYERNYVTNEILDKNNIEVITIPSSELSRGRGGPRCMSMPLYREEIVL